VRVLRKTSI